VQPPINASILQAADAPPPTGPLAAAFARAKASVVHVLVEVGGPIAFALEKPGSGVVLTEDGLVVTPWDLVRPAQGATDKTVFVQRGDGSRLAAKIVGHDDASGLALLQVELPAGTTLPAQALSSDPSPGDPALVLSLHDGQDFVASAGVVTPAQGGVAVGSGSEARLLPAADLLLVDATLDERSHGAAVLSASGALLGVGSAARVLPARGEPTLQELKEPSFGFAVPVHVLRRVFGEACARAATEPAVVSVEARAVAAASGSVVAVVGGEGARPPLGNDDPYATRRRPGVGSGVVLAAEGLVVTNLHLVGGSDTATVTLADGSQWPAEKVRVDARTNSALLRVRLGPGKKLVAARFGRVDDVAVGQRLLVLGRPEGGPVGVRGGVLSAKRGGRLQVDAGVGNHNGGGAIVTLDGLLVGMADAGTEDAVDRAFARRGEHAKLDAALDLSPGLDLLRETYRAELDGVAGTNPTLAEPAAGGAAAAAGSVAAVVERTAGALLNVYVQVTTAAADLEDNPFADAAGKTTTEGLGSGVVIDASGLALTNWHVVASATLADGSMRQDRVVRASLRDGRTFPVRVLSTSRDDDLALLRLELGEGESLAPLTLGSAAALSVGDQAIAVGNPHGLANTVTVGVITAKNQALRYGNRWHKLPQLVETDAAINAGNSGGALLDSEGRLIGINSAGGSLRATTGYAINVDHVRAKLGGLLLTPERLRSAYPGVAVADLDGRVRAQAVDVRGPGAAAGIQVDDVLATVAGAPVRWSVDWALFWLAVPPGQSVAVEIERGAARSTVQVKPWSAATRAVWQQAALQLEDLSIAADADTVRDAALAATRRFYRDAEASLRDLPEGVVRVMSVDPMLAAKTDVHAGDVLLGVVQQEQGRTGDSAQLVRFDHVIDAQRFFQEHASYDGDPFTAWLYRGGEVHVVTLRAKRLRW